MNKPLLPIPEKTVMSFCRLCQRPIFWITTPGGRRMAIDHAVDGGYPPSDRDEGKGCNHIETCPKADTIRERLKARHAAPLESYG